ncbi:Transcription termination factor MTERF9, chloroplastic [Linum grandiflorum]
MAVSSLYPLNPMQLVCFPCHGRSGGMLFQLRRMGIKRCWYVVPFAHSNARILKSNRKSKFGEMLFTYDSDDGDEEEEEDYDADDWVLDDEFAEPSGLFEVNGMPVKSRKKTTSEQGKQRQVNTRLSDTTSDTNGVTNLRHSKSKTEHLARKSAHNSYKELSEVIVLDKKWLPLLDYLTTFGLKESHFIHIYNRHKPFLRINVSSAEQRLEYLMSVGVKQRDVKRILLKQPQILEYTVEKNLKPHVAFLRSLGVPNSRMGQIIAASPSLLSYSVERSLKPTVRYLVEEVGINEKILGKVVKLSPQILVQRIDISWNTRYIFLSKELGAPRDNIVKMVTKHPQLLHYSIDNGLLPRINFLRSIGLNDAEIVKVMTSLTQVLSLSLEDNLKPKYMYLINELQNEVKSLTKYPMYFSLSLDQRIRPRHKFLVSLKKAPPGPFPLSSFVPTDESFCQQWAGTSLDAYLNFRKQLLLRKLAKKYERKG